MFSHQFASGIIAVTAQGNPAWVAAPITDGRRAVGGHPVLANVPSRSCSSPWGSAC
jgi:hypothetical protein